MHHIRCTTPVPERLSEDLAKPRVVVRYRDDHGQECTIELKEVYLEFTPYISGIGRLGGRRAIPLADVRFLEIGDEFTDYAESYLYGSEPVVQPLAVACWLRTLWGTLLRFIPQGNR